MGYELNQLMKRYGVSTPTMSSYGGVGAPTALAADATAAQKDQFVTDSGNYMAQKAAYDQYKNDYQNRIASTSAYQDSPLFKGEKKSWDTPLKTPNYSLATPKTDADYAPIISKAYEGIGRTGIGDKVSNIDQAGYDSMMYQLKTGAVSPEDFNAYFTKGANDYMNKNPNTDLTKYVQGYQNSKNMDANELQKLGQMPLVIPVATPAAAATSTPTATATSVPEDTSTSAVDPYAYPDNFDLRYSINEARGGHIKYAHGGSVQHFSGGGYNKIDGGINDLVDKYDLANPAELPVTYAEANTGTTTDAAPNYPVSDAKLRDMQNSAVRAGEPPMQRGPVPPAEGNPEMTTPTPTGGATLGAAPAPSGQTPLEVLHQKYLNAGRQPKSAEMTAAEQKYASKNDALISLLKEQANKTEDNAPSKAEMYFRLAAALAAPTKTGAFTENMGLAAKELADFQKSTTDAKKAAAAAKLQLLLKTGEIDAQQAKEELANLKEGEKEGRDVARTFAMKEYETEAKKTEKQAELVNADEQAAAARGLKKGTPAFQEFVTGLQDRRKAKEDIELGIKQSAEKRAADVAKQKSEELTSKEADLRDKTKDQISSGTQAIQDLKRALTLNEAAYDNSTVDTTQRKLLEAVGSKSPKLVNTQELETLLGEQMVARLKSSFGGNPSNKEGEMLAELQGARAKNNETRKKIIARAIIVAQERLENEKSKLAEINAGKWKSILNPAKPAAEGSE